MSIYEPLWEYIKRNEPEVLSYETVEAICGFPIDHAFLTYINGNTSFLEKLKRVVTFL